MKLSKIDWITLAIGAVLVAGLLAINAYVLDMTHGCYNAIDVLFM